MNTTSKAVITLVGGLVAIALAATVFSKKANTSSVINSGGSAVSNALSAAQGSTK